MSEDRMAQTDDQISASNRNVFDLTQEPCL